MKGKRENENESTRLREESERRRESGPHNNEGFEDETERWWGWW